MYLRRLELYGFKTFADRTELEFGPGITAIVGPNGSGKSNISDSILWVLGEQGMKSLRSAKSTDVIFNGSDARKAHGMAEVHLTLDNSTGLLPTDFSEVTVTRRVFRSGDSEYALNRTPVRLRDVQNLFYDTGIGKQSYSIISQGEVDAVLSSNSEERRALFEEVAGINKYKHRKKDALKKLEQTRLNLLRVSDIIAELESQLGPLAEQSEKARQYQFIHDELTVLQLSLLVAQYQGLHSSLLRSREREDEQQREMEGLRHLLLQCEVKETTLRAELQAIEEDLEELRGVEQRLGNTVQAAENTLALLRQQEENARKECERLRQERADWEGQSGQFDAEITAAEAEQQRLQALIAGYDAEALAVDVAAKDAASAVQEVTRLIQERRGAYLDAMDQVARMRNDLTRVESLLRTSEGRTARLTDEQREVAARLAERNAALAAALAELAARQAKREALNKQRGEAARARQGTAETQAAIRHEETQRREELAALRARQHTLQELEDSLEGYFPGVRAVMAAVSAGTLHGWYAPVSELFAVPAELETAIEVALGAGLQDVATDSEASARAGIALLKASRAGRATFLPLDLLAPAPRASTPARPGILGVAMDLIGYDAQHELVAQHHLGRVIIAQDLDAALALAKSNEARGWNRIVTLEGEVIHPSRAITGGSPGKAGGLLKRKRELQELLAQVETLEGSVNTLQRRAREAAAELQRLDAEIAALAKDAERAAVSVAESERSIAATQRDIASQQERQSALADELTWIGKEVESARAEEAKYLEHLGTLERAQHDAEEAITEAERSLTVGQNERDAVNERVAALRLQLSETRGLLHTSEATARRASGLRTALAERLAQHAREEAELTNRIAAVEVKQREAQAELLRLREAHVHGSDALEGAKNRRAAMLESIAAALDEQKSRRALIEECQGRLHRANLRTTQVETELGFLEGQFFDDYRLTPDQAIARAVPVENRGVAVVRLKELQGQVEELGTVNLGAIEEFDRVGERLNFLTTQRRDLEDARDALTQVIAEIDITCKEKFLAAFKAIAHEFQDIFVRLFGGGETQLSLTDPADVLESGIEIHVTIPGKRNQHLLQLSGGERALTALALLFAMLRVKPSPFVVLDEIDAPLDEANVGRYCEVLRDFCQDTQFLIVTHNKGTMEAADVLYGVTMEKAGVSKIVSVRLAEGVHLAQDTAPASVTTQEGPFQNSKARK